jgi:hypothetical protein
MKENEILEEIHRIRAQHAAECGYDVTVLLARMDTDLQRLQAEGWQVATPAPRERETAGALREESSQPAEKRP